ncbi:uncharacterized protein LOC132724291 [Ruditapes philippinarum]|uniref:uncharacterized protein LOC132724291 n=1 Tax=Ruditapes philippinarum TaxID=129788 RepID=UPI00295A75C8|nr:uncharacterized protein LOC132724291 [Ruditapes philippinarum]
MCSMRWFLLKSCIFGVYISITEANVSLKTSDGKTTYLIDSTVELVCTITSYNNEMTWYVDNVPYADCFLGTCGPSPNKPYTFQYTFDETAGVFNLTISSVNFSHANLTFVCDDGTQRDTISFNVTTDKGQNHSSTSNTSNSPTKSDINNQTTGTGTKLTTVPFNISPVSVLPKTTPVTPVSKIDKKLSYFVLFILLAFVVLIFSMVTLFYLFLLIKTGEKKE